MEVYLWRHFQGDGAIGVAVSQELAQRELKRAINMHQGCDPDDDTGWDSWAFWIHESGMFMCFGSKDMTCAEGTICKKQLVIE